MGRGGEGTIEEKREGEKKDNAGGKDREKGEKREEEKKKKRMQGVCFEPLPC